jgi:hypothetical protein
MANLSVIYWLTIGEQYDVKRLTNRPGTIEYFVRTMALPPPQTDINHLIAPLNFHQASQKFPRFSRGLSGSLAF